MKIRLLVIFGGKSVEHEVSIISAIQAINNLNKEKYEVIPLYIAKNGEFFTGESLLNISNYQDMSLLLQKAQKVVLSSEDKRVFLSRYPSRRLGKSHITDIDVAFPITHGTNVEDGALQGYLRTIGLPFVGCDVLASAVGMDKYASKILLKNDGFPVLDALKFTSVDFAEPEKIIGKIEKTFSYPVIVKPINLGSSVGITKAKTRAELETAIETAFSFANAIIVEIAVQNLREINCSVVGDFEQAEASECEEPVNATDILSYTDKYGSGGGAKSPKSSGMASLKRKIPADISPELRAKIRDVAVKAFQHLDCAGVTRIDFLLNSKTNEFWINEFNTIPGSLAFYLWEPVGVKYTDLLDKLIILALKRQRRESNINYTFDTNILSGAGGFGAKGAKGAKG